MTVVYRNRSLKGVEENFLQELAFCAKGLELQVEGGVGIPGGRNSQANARRSEITLFRKQPAVQF